MDYLRKIEDVIFAIRNAKDRNVNINLLIGAGCSVSAGIPLAKDIINKLHERYPLEMCRVRESNYADCMSKLTPVERRLFIADFIDNSKINWAHICIAMLLKHKYINRVLTTNFDNLLSRACSIVGEFPGIYDLALTKASTFRSDLLFDNSIIYLHGQHTGFILCNTYQEVIEQKKNISSVFRDLDKNSLWIVIGYSGQNDAIFELFTEVKPFENRLFWIGYKEHDPCSDLKDKLLGEKEYAFYVKGYDADSFFMDLCERLEIFPPQFVEKPFTYLKNIIDPISSYEQLEKAQAINSRNIMYYTNDMIDEAINNYENNVERMARLYLDMGYVDKFFNLFTNNSSKENERIIELLDDKIDESKKHYVNEIEKLEQQLNYNNINIKLVLKILENVNKLINLGKCNTSEIEKYFDLGKKIFNRAYDKENKDIILVNLASRMYYLYTKNYLEIDSSLFKENINDSLKFVKLSIQINYNKRAIQNWYDTIEYMISIKDSKVEFYDGLCIAEIKKFMECIEPRLYDTDNEIKVYYGLVSSFRERFEYIFEEKVKILKMSIDIVENVYFKDKSDSRVIFKLIELNETMLALYKENGKSHFEILGTLELLYKTIHNLEPDRASHLIELNKIVSEKYLNDYYEENNKIDEIYKNFLCILLKTYKYYSYNEFFDEFLFNDLLQFDDYEYITNKYCEDIQKVFSELNDSDKDDMLEINNEICYDLLDRIQYENDDIRRKILDFTSKILDFCLDLKGNRYLLATKGLWYLKNTNIEVGLCEKRGCELYEEAIEKCDGILKNAFTQKYYLELTKFYYERISNLDEASIYCVKGIEIGNIEDYDKIYSELLEINKKII